MKNITSFAFACYLFVGTSFAQVGESCCAIVNINSAKGIITSRNSNTGKVQHFKTSALGLKNLRMGDKLTVQNGKITGVNETRFEPVNGIEGEKSDGAHKGEIELEIFSLQVNESDQSSDIVTVKNRTTGQMYSFKTMGGIGRTLTLGQSVNLQNGYAMVQSGAGATVAQKGMYAFKTGTENTTSEVKENKDETSAEKWVISPTGLKGAAGTVSVNLPAGVEWNLVIKTSEDRALGRWDDKWDNKKTINLIPGEYNIFFTYIPVLGVPIQKGMNTRLKAGILDVVTTGQWSIHDENKTKVHVVYYKPSKIGLPIGKYNLQINGQYQQVEIKEGAVTEL